MRKLLFSLVVACLALGTTGASPESDAMGPVRLLIKGFNTGDMKAITSSCAQDMAILDDVPPHEWHGPGALMKWLADYDKDAKKNGVTDGKVTLGKVAHCTVTGDRAYIVVGADYVYKKKGKPVTENGNTMTIAEQKMKAGWKITAWAWAKH